MEIQNIILVVIKIPSTVFITTLKFCMFALYQLHIQNTSSRRSNTEFCLLVSNNLLSISSKTRGDQWWFRAQKQIPTPHLKNSSQLNKITFHKLAVGAAHPAFYHKVLHSVEDHIVHHYLQTKMLQMTEVVYLLGSSPPNDWRKGSNKKGRTSLQVVQEFHQPKSYLRGLMTLAVSGLQ